MGYLLKKYIATKQSLGPYNVNGLVFLAAQMQS